MSAARPPKVHLTYPLERADYLTVSVPAEMTEDDWNAVRCAVRDDFLPARLRASREVRDALVVTVNGHLTPAVRDRMSEVIRALVGRLYNTITIA